MPKTKKKDGVEQIVAKAFAHPLRVQILIILNERVASPNLLAQELDQSLNLVAYHVRVLEKYDCIELVDTKQRRGATEHFYRATRRQFLSDAEWSRMPTVLRPGLSGAMLKAVFDDIEEAVSKNTFDEIEDRHLSRVPMVVDKQGWDDVAATARRDPRPASGDSGRGLRTDRRRGSARHALQSGDAALQVAGTGVRGRDRGRSRSGSRATGFRVSRRKRQAGAAQGLSGAAASGVATTKEKLSSR